jgi:hypothetical protein
LKGVTASFKKGDRMRILIGCEESAVVRDAFRARGHDAYSCDIQGTRGDSAWHITGDVFKAIRKRGPWDMMICFPPCTFVTVAANRWIKEQPGRFLKQRAALEFMRDLLESDVEQIAMENPIGVFSSYWRKPDQVIQPWQFGHRETKATCLWLKNLPKLVPTEIVGPPRTPEEKIEFARVHRMPPGPNRARDRSVTYKGIAAAMAAQWG